MHRCEIFSANEESVFEGHWDLRVIIHREELHVDSLCQAMGGDDSRCRAIASYSKLDDLADIRLGEGVATPTQHERIVSRCVKWAMRSGAFPDRNRSEIPV